MPTDLSTKDTIATIDVAYHAIRAARKAIEAIPESALRSPEDDQDMYQVWYALARGADLMGTLAAGVAQVAA